MLEAALVVTTDAGRGSNVRPSGRAEHQVAVKKKQEPHHSDVVGHKILQMTKQLHP